jgi:hypothetical protein
MDGLKGDVLAVDIAGETVKVYAENGQEYIIRMANYINFIIDDFNKKKGPHVRQSIQLIYAALDLCDALFTERDGKMTESERDYEKQFQMEVFSHKRTQDQLAETEKLLEQTRRELDEYIKTFDTGNNDG